MATKAEEIAELTIELAEVNTAITNIHTNGQSFKKGGMTGFAVDQAKLNLLYTQKKEIKAKIATWELQT